MAQDIETEPTQLFQFDPVAVSKPARPSIGLKVLQGVAAICSFAVVVTMLSAGVVWIVNRAHQQQQTSAGRGPVDENEYYDWTQHLPKDANSNRQ